MKKVWLVEQDIDPTDNIGQMVSFAAFFNREEAQRAQDQRPINPKELIQIEPLNVYDTLEEFNKHQAIRARHAGYKCPKCGKNSIQPAESATGDFPNPNLLECTNCGAFGDEHYFEDESID